MESLNLVTLLEEELFSDDYVSSGNLRVSSDLLGSLRHAQLRLAGAPSRPNNIAQQIRLETGTMWHTRMTNAIVKRGVPFMQEVNCSPFLPDGWGGRADWLVYDTEAGGFVLTDLKTIKAEGIRWIRSGGMKDEHLWQLSAYFHALVRAGIPMVNQVQCMYVPMGDTTDDQVIEPILALAVPVGQEEVWERMEQRAFLTKAYIESLAPDGVRLSASTVPESWITEFLAPVQERIQKTFWVGAAQQWDLKLVPHWSSMFCPYESDLCDCSEAGVTKIGHYTLEGVYVPRNGFADVAPTVVPSEADVSLRRQLQPA